MNPETDDTDLIEVDEDGAPIQSSKSVEIKNPVFECATCGQKFILESSFQEHIFSKHPELVDPGTSPKNPDIPNNPSIYNCITCSSKFNDERSLLLHIKTKHPHLMDPKNPVNPQLIKPGVRPLHCGKCSRIFEIEADYRDHMRTLHPGKSF